MTSLSGILSDARSLVVPNPVEEERLASLARSLLTKTKREAKKFTQTRGVFLGGSYAKGTWLPGLVDIDIFVKIDPSVSDEEFERIGLAVGSSATKGFPHGKKYAQHPYTEATLEGTKVNIVPCFAVKKGKWRSAADRSPFHVSIVRSQPTELKVQVRLLKRFMKGVGVYGAEIKRQGFSGYVAEVLVMKHNTLLQVLKWFSDYPASGVPNISIADPIDVRRDLGIAVSGESLGRMVLASRGFLRHPKPAYFQSMEGKRRPTLERDIAAVKFSHRELSEDTLWGELRRTCKHIVRHLEMNGFVIVRSMSASDDSKNSAFLFLPELSDLPPISQRVGPTVDRRKDVEAFLHSNSKHSKLVWVDDEARIRLLMPRLHTSLVPFLEQIIRGKVGEVGASAEIETSMRRTGSVIYGAKLVRAASRAKWLHDGIREITTDAVGTS
jgi:tRNA nucleotidyltransferase (CCA-adding enzyme)